MRALVSCLVLSAGVAGLLGCSTPSFASRMVDVTIINRTTGERLTPYRHDGKLYVAGTPGDAYAIELKSRRGERLLGSVSVDGVNVLTGQTAATSQSGYVLDGWRSYGISGWRKSMDDVAKFVFTALPDSYAARTGRPDNVGVIGVAVYREQPAAEPTPYSSSQPAPEISARRDAASAKEKSVAGALGKLAQSPAAAPIQEQAAKTEGAAGSRARNELDLADRKSQESAADSSAQQEKKAMRLGTGHGDRERAPTRYTEFQRASDRPDEIVTIYYDSRRSLVARGIIREPRIAEPAPFPAGIGFVPDPRS